VNATSRRSPLQGVNKKAVGSDAHGLENLLILSTEQQAHSEKAKHPPRHRKRCGRRTCFCWWCC